MATNRPIRIVLLTVGPVAALIAAFLIYITCYRGPNEQEIRSRYLHPPVTSLAIDWSQADVGMYWITEHSPGGMNEYALELSPQWLWPWSSYRWEHVAVLRKIK